MGSPGRFREGGPAQLQFLKMDAIKKKMQAMKVEKDNAMDRSDVCEQASKDAKVRAAKAEEEVAELVKKAQQLEVELDKTKEELSLTTEKLKEKENNLLSAELEVNSLNRRVQSLEGDLETCEDKLIFFLFCLLCLTLSYVRRQGLPGKARQARQLRRCSH